MHWCSTALPPSPPSPPQAADARPTPPPTHRHRRRASAGLCSNIQATKDPMLISHLYLMLQVIRRSFSSLISLSHTFPLPFHSIYIQNSKLLAPVVCFAELVCTCSWAVCAQHHAPYTQLFSGLAKKQSNVPNLKST